jgi:arylsulfatase A-like enzyme
MKTIPMRRFFLALLLAALAIQTHAADRKPNILLIVLDDAGYSDIAGFGRDDAPTPNIRQIANEGVRFTRHYADSTCRPARLALLTGRESARVAQNPDFRGISPEIITLPEALKTAGYRTAHIGKWHLGDAVRDAWPDKQGFEHWFGFLNQFQLKGPDKNGDFTKRPTYIDPWLQSDNTPLQQYHGHLEDILAAHDCGYH